MGTTADKLNYLLATKDEIKAAITAKGVDVSSSTFRECAQKIREIPQEVNVNVLEPTITAGNANVRFIDYDGTLIHSYTKDEFLALNELPILPTRERLTCQGWNYTLEDAKAFVEEYDKCDIGATYITDDGKTRLYILVPKGRQDVPLYFSQTIENGVTIDWGDGSTETLSGSGEVNTTHHYNEIGDYVISLDVADGCTLGLGHGSSSYGIIGGTTTKYSNMLKRAEIGKAVTSIGENAFYLCYSLSSVVLPQGVTIIRGSAFYCCYALSSVVIPKGVTSIEYDAFQYCYSLVSVEIPQGVTSIGVSAFQSCYALSSIVLPQGVTYIGAVAFGNCHSLSSVVIPQGVTSIGDTTFYYCSSLSSVEIPQGVTSIGGSIFSHCFSLVSVVIPQGVTSVGTYVFSNCYSIAFIDFRAATSVPSLSSTTAFYDIPSDCKIIVPDALYDEWIAATNWSTYASQIIKALEFESI